MTFLLCLVTYNFGYATNICFCSNFKLWMEYCASWHCDDVLLRMLTPIPISVYLHIKKILCFNKKFYSSYNFLSIMVLSCSVYASDVNMITQNPLVVFSGVLMAPYFPDSTNEAYYHLFHQE